MLLTVSGFEELVPSWWSVCDVYLRVPLLGEVCQWSGLQSCTLLLAATALLCLHGLLLLWNHMLQKPLPSVALTMAFRYSHRDIVNTSSAIPRSL